MVSTDKIEEGDCSHCEKDLTELLPLKGIESAVEQLISSNEILMFSKSTCAYCFGEYCLFSSS